MRAPDATRYSHRPRRRRRRVCTRCSEVRREPRFAIPCRSIAEPDDRHGPCPGSGNFGVVDDTLVFCRGGPAAVVNSSVIDPRQHIPEPGRGLDQPVTVLVDTSVVLERGSEILARGVGRAVRICPGPADNEPDPCYRAFVNSAAGRTLGVIVPVGVTVPASVGGANFVPLTPELRIKYTTNAPINKTATNAPSAIGKLRVISGMRLAPIPVSAFFDFVAAFAVSSVPQTRQRVAFSLKRVPHVGQICDF